MHFFHTFFLSLTTFPDLHSYHPQHQPAYNWYDYIYRPYRLRKLATIQDMFVDKVEIELIAGHGGSGLASFNREKFKPFGGPDGGDGGKGGDIFMLASDNAENLKYFKHKSLFRAENGGRGGKNKMHGINAPDLIIMVPVGTSAYVKQDGAEVLIADLNNGGKKVLLARGGKGGKGNIHYATATRKAPRIFQPGEEGQQLDIVLRLTLATDVCIIGYPNSGKSTLLVAISGARPQVAEYPFTTTEPALGTVDDGVDKLAWCEMPALIEGSHQGKGLGNRFLCHAERAKVLVLLLDGAAADPAVDLRHLKQEIAAFDDKMTGKNLVVAVNKIDLIESAGKLDEIRDLADLNGVPLVFISAKLGQGLSELVTTVHKITAEKKVTDVSEIKPEVVFRPKPVDRRD
jgi:GTP-binding protein